MSIHALANSSPAIAQNAARSRIVAASELRGSAHQIGGSSTAGGAWRDPVSWLGPISVIRLAVAELSHAQAGARLMFKRRGPPHAAYGSDAPRQLTRAKWWLATAVVLFASLVAFIVSRLS